MSTRPRRLVHRPSPALGLLVVLAAGLAPARADALLDLDTLVVGRTTYREVSILSRDERSVFFRYANGLGSARLRDLPADVQGRLGFDPALAPAEPVAATRPSDTAARAPAPRSGGYVPEQVRSARARLDRLFLSYDTDARLAPRQSLRDDFARLALTAKSQGRRPSCSIYAIVSALEFQYFQTHGRVEDFSEEYLIWATRRSEGLVGRDGLAIRNARGEPVTDAGYTLPSVIQAMATYGVALEAEMPALPPARANEIPVPAADLIDRSRARRAIYLAAIPGREPDVLLKNLVHALNAGYPVPAGIRWPGDRSTDGVLDRQPPQPDAFHAVTFIGYECPSTRPEDAFFIFKNSYGERWGDQGYGRASWAYLARNLMDAYVIDVGVFAPSS